MSKVERQVCVYEGCPPVAKITYYFWTLPYGTPIFDGGPCILGWRQGLFGWEHRVKQIDFFSIWKRADMRKFLHFLELGNQIYNTFSIKSPYQSAQFTHIG